MDDKSKNGESPPLNKNTYRISDFAAYDKHGNVYAVVKSSLKPPTIFPHKAFSSEQEYADFVSELTFMRYSYKGNWKHVLVENGIMSADELSSNQLGGLPYTQALAIKKISELLLKGVLSIYPTGEFIPSAERNHHQPPKPSGDSGPEPYALKPVTQGPDTEPEPDNWIDLEYLYADGTGVAGASYTVKELSASLISSGTLDKQGQAHVVMDIRHTQVKVSFDKDPSDVAVLVKSDPQPVAAPEGWFDRMSQNLEAAWKTAKQAHIDVAVWSWGVIQGDFKEDPSIGQVITNAIITAIPVVDQIGDVRDLTANLKLLIWDKKYTEFTVWLALFFTLIGLIPTLGSVLKGVLKLIWKGAKLDDLLKLFNYFMKGNGIKWLKELKSGKLDEYAKQAAELGIKLFDEIIAKVKQLKQKVPKTLTSIHDNIKELLQTLGTVKSQINEQFAKIAEELKKKLGRVLDESAEKVETGNAKGKYSRKQEADEVSDRFDDALTLKLQAEALELADGGHSLLRHGPEVSDADLRRRALTGISPDHKWSPTHYSTKFDTYDDWLKTRENAILRIQQDNQVNFGANMDIAPAPGSPTSYKIEIDHERAIDSGFNGTGPRTEVVNPYNNSQTRNLHTQVTPVSGITKSYTKIAWDANASRWKVVQHFPVSKDWNQALQRYDS